MDNHFIPRFYLSRWAIDGELIEYRKRRNGKITGKPVAPKGTGYKPDLYKNTHKNDADAHIFEVGFLNKHDTLASDALKKLEAGTSPNDKEMCGWISFLMALQLRHPDDIAIMRPLYEKKWAEGMKPVRDKLAHFPKERTDLIHELTAPMMEEAMFRLLAKLMEHQDIGQMLLDFDHTVTDLNSTLPLVTSDRPVLMTPTFGEDNAYLILPIGPKKLYVCGKTKNTVERILNKKGKDLVKLVNDQVSRHASISVYSTQENLDGYVSKRLGTSNYDSYFTRLSRMWDN